MAPFDPYHTWLGIPPDKQPPHYYRLLGLAAFEDNPTVIEEAADRQMAHVKRHERGKYSEQSQKLLNEISAAKVALLNPDKKQLYDQKLKALAARRAGAARQKESPASGPAFPNIAAESSTSVDRIKRTRQRPGWLLPVVVGGGALSLAVLIGLGFLLLGGSAAPPEPSPNRNQALASAAPAAELTPQAPSPAEDLASDNSPSLQPDSAATDGAQTNPRPTADNIAASEITPSHELPPVSEPLASTQPGDDEVSAAHAAADPSDNAPQETAQPEGDRRTLADLGATATEQERSLADLVEAPAKAPPPSDEQLRAAAATINDLYRNDIDAARDEASQIALARKLLGEAESASFRDAPVGRFALLIKARDLASSAGDVGVAIRAIDAIDAGFDIDPLPLQVAALQASARAARSAEARESLVQRALEVIDSAVAAERFAAAEDLASLAAQAAARLRVADVRKSVQELARQAERFAQAQATLAANPDDPAANLLVGRFLCLAQGDWKQGLPHLARSGIDSWSAAAANDAQLSAASSAAPADSAQQLADAWWEIADKHRNQQEQAALRLRAAHWYRVASGQLSGIEKLALDKRISEAEQAAAAVGQSPTLQGNAFVAAATLPIAADAPAGLVKTFTGHQERISSCRFSADHRRIVTTSHDETVRVWDVATAAELFSAPHHANFASFASPNHVYSVGYDDRVVVWDLRTKQPVRQHSYTGAWGGARADDCAAAPYFAYSTCWALALVHVEQGREVKFPKPEHAAISAVSLSRDGQTAITGDREGAVRLWSVPQVQHVKKLAEFPGELHAVALSPNNRIALAGYWKRPGEIIALLDSSSGEELRTHRLTWVDSVAFSPDGRRYAACGREAITAWETDTGKTLQNFSVPDIWNRVVCFSADGGFLLTGSDDHLVRLWKIDDPTAAE